MVQTAIRPDDYVEFRDETGEEVLVATGDDEGIWLSELVEPAPEVRTLTVEVPGADGVLDLSEAVAGRPLYGNREIEVTLSIVSATHPDAVRAVGDIRRAIHGKAVQLETPDSRALGGWYTGRASIGEVEYPGEAATVQIVVDAHPWIVLGNHTVTLTNRGYATYGDGNLTTAHGDDLPHGIVTIDHFTPAYENGYSTPMTLRLATADTANTIDSSLAKWSLWTLSEADWAAAGQSTGWDTAWDQWALVEDVDGLSLHFEEMGNVATATRLLLSVANRDTYCGIPRSGTCDRIGIRITGTVVDSASYTDYPDALGKQYSAIEFVHVSSATMGQIKTTGSEMRPTSGTVRVANAPYDSPSTLGNADGAAAWFDHAYRCGTSGSYAIEGWSEVPGEDSKILLRNGRPYGYSLVMVELRWTRMTDVTITPFMCPQLPVLDDDGESGVWEARGFSATSEASLTHPIYCYNTTTDSLATTPVDSVYWSRLEGGETQSPTVRPEPVAQPGPTLRPPEAAPYVRAYQLMAGSTAWVPLNLTVEIPKRGTATLDSGDMPSPLSVHVPGTAIFDADGETYTMKADAVAPFSAIGELELGYRFYTPTGDGSVTFSEGTL